MSTEQPSSTISWSRWRPDFLRGYWIIASLLMLVLMFIVWMWAIRGARITLAGQMSHDMSVLVPQMDDAYLEQLPQSLQADSRFGNRPYQLAVITTNGDILYRTTKLSLQNDTLFDGSEQIVSYVSGTLPGSEFYRSGGWTPFGYEFFEYYKLPETDLALILYAGIAERARQALLLALPAFAGITLTTLAGLAIAALLTKQHSDAMNRLAQASHSMLEDGKWAVDLVGIDDQWELGAVAYTMDRLCGRAGRMIDDLSRLQVVSRQMSSIIRVNEGMPIILEGLQKGSGASAARAVVINSRGGKPMLFGAGIGSETMAIYDRQILNLVRQGDEFVLDSAEQIRDRLKVSDGQPISFHSIVVFTLRHSGKLLGALAIGFNDVTPYQPQRLDFMRAFVQEATSLIHVTRLFTVAEGGRRRLAAVLGSTQDAVAVTDNTNRIIFINPAMESAFGLLFRDVFGRDVADVIDKPDLLAIFTAMLDSVHLREIEGVGETTYRASVSHVSGQENRFLGRVAVFHDITRLKEIDSMKSAFIANVSHDLRNPLVPMHTYALMLESVGDLNTTQREYVEHIVGGIDRMHKLLGAILDLGRIEAGVEIEREEINFNKMLIDLVSEQDAHAQLNGNRITLKMPTSPLFVHGDKWMLTMAVGNLLNNAIKYAPDSGEIRLQVEEAEKANKLILSVHDDGPGISKVDQSRIFEKFYRGSEPETPQVVGSGLGLAIVKSAAQQHGGAVWLKSSPDEGTTMYLSLPLHTPL